MFHPSTTKAPKRHDGLIALVVFLLDQEFTSTFIIVVDHHLK